MTDPPIEEEDMPRLNTKPIPELQPEYIERFWSLVEKTDTCWIWKGTANETRYRYGLFTVADGTRHRRYRILAARVAYKLQYGVDPGEKFVCHTCDNPRCVAGTHLFLGTSADNNKDRHRKGRSKVPSRESRLGNYKLTDDLARTIRARFMTGTVTRKQLAEDYGVSRSTIENVINNTAWHQTL